MNDLSLQTVRTALSGYELLNDPLLNKGTAFTEAERDAFELHGLLPPHVATLDYQLKRRLDAFRKLGSDIQKYVFLRGLQDTNETLFYALLTRNIEEMMPIVYTPTVGLGCQQFSSIFRKPRGLFLSYPHKDDVRRILGNPRFDGVEAIVVSDGERILGLGDQGAGGMGIPIGKLSLYTACAGLHPATTLPIILDVGTDSREHLDDPQYIGWQHERMRGDAYDAFIATFVDAVRERWPHVLLHWEDFAIGNANRLLARYRDSLCTFNDDIQGTAAIAVGTLLSAINVTGTPLNEQRVAVFGAGSAGTGICALLLRAMVDAGLPEPEARSRFFLVDRDGLLVDSMTGLQPFQAPFAQKRAALSAWIIGIARPDRPRRRRRQCAPDRAHRHVGPAARVPRGGGARHGRPRAPAGDLSAVESDRARRGDAAGTVRMDRRPRRHRHRQSIPADRSATVSDFRVDQTNNAYVYPGIGLGAIAAKARHISDGMFLAAARTIAEMSPAKHDPQANLLPPLVRSRELSFHVAIAVAKRRRPTGLPPSCRTKRSTAAVKAKMWEPVYADYVRLRA